MTITGSTLFAGEQSRLQSRTHLRFPKRMQYAKFVNAFLLAAIVIPPAQIELKATAGTFPIHGQAPGVFIQFPASKDGSVYTVERSTDALTWFPYFETSEARLLIIQLPNGQEFFRIRP